MKYTLTESDFFELTIDVEERDFKLYPDSFSALIKLNTKFGFSQTDLTFYQTWFLINDLREIINKINPIKKFEFPDKIFLSSISENFSIILEPKSADEVLIEFSFKKSIISNELDFRFKQLVERDFINKFYRYLSEIYLQQRQPA